MKRKVWISIATASSAIVVAVAWPALRVIVLPGRTSMSAAEVIVRLFLVAGLASYLYLKHYQRVRQRSVRQIPPDWDGKCLDVSQLKPAIENVRRDYQAAQTSPRRRCHHQDLLELAKHAVLRLAYFQHGNTSSAQIEPCPTDKPTLS